MIGLDIYLSTKCISNCMYSFRIVVWLFIPTWALMNVQFSPLFYENDPTITNKMTSTDLFYLNIESFHNVRIPSDYVYGFVCQGPMGVYELLFFSII